MFHRYLSLGSQPGTPDLELCVNKPVCS